VNNHNTRTHVRDSFTHSDTHIIAGYQNTLNKRNRSADISNQN